VLHPQGYAANEKLNKMRRPLQRRCLSAKRSSRFKREFFQNIGKPVDFFGMLVAVWPSTTNKRDSP
jgi:hypothetical protein